MSDNGKPIHLWDIMPRDHQAVLMKLVDDLLPSFVEEFEIANGRGPAESETDSFTTGVINGIILHQTQTGEAEE